MNRMDKICIIAPVHPYNDVRVFQKEAKSLKKNAYVVQVISNIDSQKVVDGIQVIKAPVFNNRIQRILLNPIILFQALKTKSDIYHLHNPDTLIIGFVLKAFGKKVIYDTHEDFSKRILMREWIPILLRKTVALVVKTMEKTASKYFDAVIVTQPQMLDKFGGKSHLIENAPILQNDLTDMAYKLSESISEDDKVVRLIYVGGISRLRGVLEIIKVLERLNETHSFRLWLIGPCSDNLFLEELKRMNGWKYVDYLGFLPQEEAFAHMIKSDIGLVTILDVGDHSTTSPNKLFEYQRFALPFVASNFPKWIQQVADTESGIFVDPLDIDKITQSLITLGVDPEVRMNMGRNGQLYIFNKFNWDIESEKLIDLYATIK